MIAMMLGEDGDDGLGDGCLSQQGPQSSPRPLQTQGVADADD